MVLGKSYYAENIFIPTWSWYWVQQTYFWFIWDRYMLVLGDFYFNKKTFDSSSSSNSIQKWNLKFGFKFNSSKE